MSLELRLLSWYPSQGTEKHQRIAYLESFLVKIVTAERVLPPSLESWVAPAEQVLPRSPHP